ncbi:unnamed protein product, partial [Vitis vinifera]
MGGNYGNREIRVPFAHFLMGRSGRFNLDVPYSSRLQQQQQHASSIGSGGPPSIGPLLLPPQLPQSLFPLHMGSAAPRPAVIINYGTRYIKMGFSGNVEPCFIAPTVVAVNESFLNQNRSTTNPSYPIVHGQVYNWDVMERFWQQGIFNYLRCDQEDHYFLLAGSPLTAPESREYTGEIMFETFKCSWSLYCSAAGTRPCDRIHYIQVAVDDKDGKILGFMQGLRLLLVFCILRKYYSRGLSGSVCH